MALFVDDNIFETKPFLKKTQTLNILSELTQL